MISKKTTLALFITSTLASGALYAAENNNNNIIRNNAFFNDSHLQLSVKNMWDYLKEDNLDKKNVHNAWGQGLAVNYQSGYLFDIIGFDTTYYGALKLAASDNFRSRGILYDNQNHSGANKDNAQGYSKFGQRYAKVKFGDQGVGGNAYYGWKVLNRYAALGASNRLSQNSYLGLSGDTHFNEFTLRGAYVTRSMNRDSPEVVHFQTADGKNISHIMTGDISYKGESLKATYFYGAVHNYLDRHGLLLDYKLNSNWTLGSQIYASQARSDWKAMSANRRAFDNHAWHYVGELKWRNNAWSSTIGAGYTKAEKADGLGHFLRHMTRNSRAHFNSLTSAGEHYQRDGETALFSSVNYQFNEDFSTGLYLNYGQFAYKNQTVRTGEATVFLNWVPQHPDLKGLSILYKVGPGISYKRAKGSNINPDVSSGSVKHSNSLGNEIIVEYKLPLF